MSEKSKSTELDLLFPGREVPLSDGSVVTVRPLSLESLPKVARAFTVVIDEVAKGATPQGILGKAFEELSIMLPFCVDRPVREIPIEHAPEILEIVVEQNATEAVIKKWNALMLKMTEFAEQQKSETPLPKKEASKK